MLQNPRITHPDCGAPNRYFVSLRPADPPSPWIPGGPDVPIRLDCVYFGRALRAMERHGVDGLTVYLTWSCDALPRVGDDVVALVVGDESSRRPAYTDAVRAVFKCYGGRPYLSRNPLRDPSYLAAVVFAKELPRVREALVHDARLLAQHGRRVLGRAPAPRRVHAVPLGYFNQCDLPLAPFASRPTGVFFAGSVDEPRAGRRWPRSAIRGPRTLSRRQMLAALSVFERQRPEYELDVRITGGFGSIRRADADVYSRALMDARIALAPRGSSVETYRFFEALRYGCVVITEPLPRTWFYAGAPAIVVRRWKQLPAVLASLLDDPAGLHERHRASLAWWRERCSEDALGAYLAWALGGGGRRSADRRGLSRAASNAVAAKRHASGLPRLHGRG